MVLKSIISKIKSDDESDIAAADTFKITAVKPIDNIVDDFFSEIDAAESNKFTLDGYFLNMLNDIIMMAETNDIELKPIDIVEIAVYTLHSIVTSGDNYFKAYHESDIVKSTLTNVIGNIDSITEYLEVMRDAINSGDAEKMDTAFRNIGINSEIAENPFNDGGGVDE